MGRWSPHVRPIAITGPLTLSLVSAEVFGAAPRSSSQEIERACPTADTLHLARVSATSPIDSGQSNRRPNMRSSVREARRSSPFIPFMRRVQALKHPFPNPRCHAIKLNCRKQGRAITSLSTRPLRTLCTRCRRFRPERPQLAPSIPPSQTAIRTCARQARPATAPCPQAVAPLTPPMNSLDFSIVAPQTCLNHVVDE